MTHTPEQSRFSHPDPKVNFAMHQFAQISGRHSASVTMQAAELAKRMQDPEYPIQDIMSDWYYPLIWTSEVTRQQLLTAATRAHSRRSRWQKIRHPIRITPEKIAGVITQVGNVADNLRSLPPSSLEEIFLQGHVLRATNHGRHSKDIERRLSIFARALLGTERSSTQPNKLQQLKALATALISVK